MNPMCRALLLVSSGFLLPLHQSIIDGVFEFWNSLLPSGLVSSLADESYMSSFASGFVYFLLPLHQLMASSSSWKRGPGILFLFSTVAPLFLKEVQLGVLATWLAFFK